MNKQELYQQLYPDQRKIIVDVMVIDTKHDNRGQPYYYDKTRKLGLYDNRYYMPLNTPDTSRLDIKTYEAIMTLCDKLKEIARQLMLNEIKEK